MKWMKKLPMVLVGLLLLALLGCNSRSVVRNEKILNTLPDEVKAEAVIKISEMQAKIKASHYTDWLLALFILAAAVGIFTFIRGRPIEGLAVIGGSVGGVLLTVYVQRIYEVPLIWMYGGALVFIGFMVFVYRDRLGKAAFKNVVRGVGVTKKQVKLIDKAKNGKVKE